MTKAAKLICPEIRLGMEFFKQEKPLALLSCCGKSLIDHALCELASQGFQKIDLYLSDRPELLREQLRNGEKWGIKISYHPTPKEVTQSDLQQNTNNPSEEASNTPVFTLDRIPLDSAASLFEDHKSLFSQLQQLIASAGKEQLGMREIRAGVWIGIGSHIPADAGLEAPCWIGRNVYLSGGVKIGPNAIIEDECLVDKRAVIQDSQIIQRTYVGSDTEIRQSIASGARLLSWKTGHSQEIQDPFLLAHLDMSDQTSNPYATGLFSRLMAGLFLILTFPISLLLTLFLSISGRKPCIKQTAARPRTHQLLPPADRFEYLEFNVRQPFFQRIPRLWSILKGDMTWVGNPPLSPQIAETLESEFDLLWLAAPCGLVSLGDCYSHTNPEQHEARTHAAYYAAKRSSKLNSKILASVLLSRQP